MKNNNNYFEGIKDSIPIFFGYLSVSFTFGIQASILGLSVFEAVLISLTNLTSAGQLAMLPIIASGGSLIEVAVTELVINSRYFLMSISLSQKLDSKFNIFDKLFISFCNTDEIFAVSSGKDGTVGKKYMLGLELLPYIGWSLGTFLGALLGSILPPMITSALGLAIYGMFIAIVIPVVKTEKPVRYCVLVAIILSCLFKYVPVLNTVPNGFVIIICAIIASTIFAITNPINVEEEV